MRLVVLLVVVVLAVASVAYASSSAEWVLTPSGWQHTSCVHGPVPDGHTVVDTGALTYLRHDATGKLVRLFAPCAKRTPPKSADAVNPLPEGWSAYAWSRFSGKTFTSYNGTWSVPAIPKDQGAQTLFLFTGFQNNFGGSSQVTNIIQPVLQWGSSAAGGGEYWSMASWYVDSAGNSHWSVLKQSTSGHTIQGNMVLRGITWSIEILDVESSVSSTLSIATNTSEPYAFVTLEVYSVSNCLEYPTGTDMFDNLVFAPEFSPEWTPVATPGCQEGVNVVNATSVQLKF